MNKIKSTLVSVLLISLILTTVLTAQDTKEPAETKSAKTSQDTDDKLRNTQDFSKFIKYFFETCYFENSIDSLIYFHDKKITNFFHPKGEFGRMTNPGAFCTMIKDSLYGYIPSAVDVWKVNEIKTLKFFKGAPVNGFCEETKSKEGVYYTTVKKFPKYYDHKKEAMVQYRLPGKLKTNQVMKVVVVKDAFIVKQFYFAKIDKKWYLILSDDCDCSA